MVSCFVPPYSLSFSWPVFVASCFMSLSVYHSHDLFLWCLVLCSFQFIVHMTCLCGLLLCVTLQFIIQLPVFVVSCFVYLPVYHSMACFVVACFVYLPVYHSRVLFLWCLAMCIFQFIIHMSCFCGVLLCVSSSLSFNVPFYVVSCFVSPSSLSCTWSILFHFKLIKKSPLC